MPTGKISNLCGGSLQETLIHVFQVKPKLSDLPTHIAECDLFFLGFILITDIVFVRNGQNYLHFL